MTKDEWKEWAMSLRPGDRVIYKNWNGVAGIAIVSKVTPTGIVRTDRGSFAQRPYFDHYIGVGKTWGNIVPLTPELEAEALDVMRREAEAKERKMTITKSGNIAYEFWISREKISYELAAELIELYDKYKEEIV